jgi:hypothetical protein
MAPRSKSAVRPANLNAALKSLVEAIASRVVDRVQQQIPEKAQMRRVERQLARLVHRAERGAGAPGARRVGRPRSDRRCKMRGCGLSHVAQGFCSKHYQAWRRKNLRSEG